jgi:hypothetical protein
MGDLTRYRPQELSLRQQEHVQSLAHVAHTATQEISQVYLAETTCVIGTTQYLYSCLSEAKCGGMSDIEASVLLASYEYYRVLLRAQRATAVIAIRATVAQQSAGFVLPSVTIRLPG